jgi:hypothetical protein
MTRENAKVGMLVQRIVDTPNCGKVKGDLVRILRIPDERGGFYDQDNCFHHFSSVEPVAETGNNDGSYYPGQVVFAQDYDSGKLPKNTACCGPWMTDDIYTNILGEAHAIPKQDEVKAARTATETLAPLQGRKYDDGKIDWSLLPLEPVEAALRVMMKGAEKYSRDNWKFVPDAARRYYNAALRHLTSWQKGERLDSEWGLPHLAHALCCLLFLSWIDEKDNKTQT